MAWLHPALSSWDIVPLVLAHLNRRQAAAAACVCKPWKEAIASMNEASKFPFRPQVVIGLARQGKVVDITDLVLPQMLPAPPLAWGVHTYRTASDKSKRAPVWPTSLAFSPHGGRHLYTCQYQAKGITQRSSTFAVSMHRHRYVHRPRRKKGAAQVSSSSASSSKGPAAQADENDDDVDVQGPSSTHCEVDADRGYLCIVENLGQGPTRVVHLPEWMDHANIVCLRVKCMNVSVLNETRNPDSGR